MHSNTSRQTRTFKLVRESCKPTAPARRAGSGRVGQLHPILRRLLLASHVKVRDELRVASTAQSVGQSGRLRLACAASRVCCDTVTATSANSYNLAAGPLRAASNTVCSFIASAMLLHENNGEKEKAQQQKRELMSSSTDDQRKR